MSYLTEHCPPCGVIPNNYNRLIVDSCGHSKCRHCFLDEERGCLQCHSDKEPDSQDPAPSRTGSAGHLATKQNRQQGAQSRRVLRQTPARIAAAKAAATATKSAATATKSAATATKSVTKATTRKSDDKSKSSLPKHIRQIIMSERLVQYHCTVCRKSFSRSQQYYHMACGGDESAKRFKCDVCDKAYISRSHLNYHMESHTDQIYNCKECNKSFTNRAVLNKHEKQHVQLPFLCTDCGREFKFKASLASHMDTHLNGPGYQCTLCDKRYTQKSSLTQHMAAHDENKFKCIHCGKRFQRNYSLTLHLKKHSDLESFVCTICFQNFADLNNLMRHAKIHGEEIKYKCTHCDLTSIRKDNILRHVKNVHAGEDIQTCVEIIRTPKNNQTEATTEALEPAEENIQDYEQTEEFRPSEATEECIPNEAIEERIPYDTIEEYRPLEITEERPTTSTGICDFTEDRPTTSTAYISIEDLLKRKPIYEYRLNEEPSEYLSAQETLPLETNKPSNEYRSSPSINAYQSSPAINEYRFSPATISAYKSTPDIREYRSSPGPNVFGSSQNMNQYIYSPAISDYRSTPGTSGYKATDESNNNMSTEATYAHLPTIGTTYEVTANQGTTYDLIPTAGTYELKVTDGQYQYIPSEGTYIVYVPAAVPTYDYTPNEELNITADFSVVIDTPQTVENSSVIKSIGNPPTPLKVQIESKKTKSPTEEATAAANSSNSSNLSILEPTHKNYYGNKRHKKFMKKYDPIELYRKILTSDEEAGENREHVMMCGEPVAPIPVGDHESTGLPLLPTFNLSNFNDMHWRKNVKYTYEYQEY